LAKKKSYSFFLHVYTAGCGNGTPCMPNPILLVVERDTYNLYVHTVGGEKGYILHVHRRLLMVLLLY
jgi:hypothetical protein